MAGSGGGVLVVDGVFAQRAELSNAWDGVVLLDVPFEVSVGRLAARDGTSGDPDHADQSRYVAAQRHYFDCCAPRESADIVIDHTDLAAPMMAIGVMPGARVSAVWQVDGDDLVRTIRLPRGQWDIAQAIDRLL